MPLERARPKDYQILAAWNRLQDNSAVAAELGLSVNTVRGSISRAKGTLNMQRPERKTLAEYLAAERVDVDLPEYKAVEPEYDGSWIVVGDVHCPTTRWDLLQLLGQFATKHLKRGERRLLIAGDLVNFDALSAYDHVVPAVTLKQELAAARAVLNYVLSVFDHVLIIQGNHDMRLLRYMQGAVDAGDFGRLISDFAHDPRVTITVQTQAIIRSAGVPWRVTHQRNYSKIAGRVADELAQKFQMNIISWHEHHTAVMRDRYNRHTLINGGGLFDERKLAYVNLVDSTSGGMSNGWVLVKNGVGHLVTPYPTMTDWSMWGMADEASKVISAYR